MLILEAGAVFRGNFRLRNKAGSEWIVIRTSVGDDLLPIGTRVTPMQAHLMPKIISPGSAPALAADPGAHNYRLIGLELAVAPTVTLNYGIVTFGEGRGSQTSSASVPHDLIIDRCYVHGNSTGDVSRGVALNSARTSIIDSYVSECHGRGFDTQAVCGWNGPGPFKIVNNYLEGAGENVLFGGADPGITGLVPSDIEFRRNHCRKPLEWYPRDAAYSGTHWTVKNLFELKNAQRVLVDGNLFENNWVDAQNGYAILFTVRNQEGSAPWSTVQDVTFVNNVVRHVASAINTLGRDYNYPSQQVSRLRIANNLFDDVNGSRWGGSHGSLLLVTDGPADITIDHNTVFQSGYVILADGTPTQAA